MEATLVVWMGCHCDQCLYKRQAAGHVAGEDNGPKEPWSQPVLLPALLAEGEEPTSAEAQVWKPGKSVALPALWSGPVKLTLHF